LPKHIKLNNGRDSTAAAQTEVAAPHRCGPTSGDGSDGAPQRPSRPGRL